MRLARHLLLALTLCTSIPTAALADGAIAYDVNSGAYGWAHNYRSLRPAEEAALGYCNRRGCRIVSRVPRGECGALARAERSTGWGEAVRRNREDARRAAIRTCENHNHGQCRILVMDCTE